MYIRAGINNNAYIKPNRIPKNLEIFLINFELFLMSLVFTLTVPADNFFENILIYNRREFCVGDKQGHWVVVVSAHNVILKKKEKAFFSQKESI